MPYLLLIIGLLIGLYALYRFFLKADVTQIKALFLSIAAAAVFIALLYLSVTGRLPAALALLAATVPLIIGYYNDKKKRREGGGGGGGAQKPSQNTPMSAEEALEVLGLEDGASKAEIKAAYKKLMKKVHPDQEGSEWMAAKLNEAKELLLKNEEIDS